MGWDPETYLDFAAERARPFHDLVGRIDPGEISGDINSDITSIVDLGSGPGGLTASLAQRWPAAHVVGVDSSPAMIAKAAAYAVPGRIDFELADVVGWAAADPVDLIVSNATLQWIPGHVELLAGWIESSLRPRGWLAFQVPGNLHDPLHRLLAELVASARWAERLGDVLAMRADVPSPETYLEVLARAGCDADVWETTYLHVLDPPGHLGPDAVLGWAQGTALRPVLDALPDNELRAEFLADYGSLLRTAYPRRPWGTLLPFRRIFAVARKVGSS